MPPLPGPLLHPMEEREKNCRHFDRALRTARAKASNFHNWIALLGFFWNTKPMPDPSLDNAWLELKDGSRQPIANSCSIGRSESNQIVLADSKVSRRNTVIHVQGDKEFWVVDLGSSNGTYLNGRRVNQPTRLLNRDRIGVGDATFTFRQPGGDSAINQTMADVTIHDIRTMPCWLLLADIIGSTEMSRKLSPQELSVVTGTWLAACKQLIEKNGGSINKFLGDGFFAYWRSVENETLSVAAALADLQKLQAQQNPLFRIILHYGDVAVGGAASMGEESLIGQEVNFVFRMEKLAGGLQQRCMMSAAAREKLPSVPTKELGKHGLSGFAGESLFYGF